MPDHEMNPDAAMPHPPTDHEETTPAGEPIAAASEPDPEEIERDETESEERNGAQPEETAHEDLAEEDAAEDEEGGEPDEVMGEAGEEGAVAVAAEEAPPPPSNKHWYVVKVQTGREESIKDAIERRVKIEGLEEFYGQIVIPVERVTEMRNHKRVTKERKLYPGYLMVEVEYNDRILYLFRETSGVGDFVGATINRPPPPMSDREVERMIGASKVDPAVTTVVHAKPKFGKGDRVKVTDGTFAGMTGEVKELHEADATVSVELRIFDRPVDVKMEYWQVELA